MKENPTSLYYSDYLQLDKILNAQWPMSKQAGVSAHDELLFIITHQTYELWFKQILHELTRVREIFKKPTIEHNSSDLPMCVHCLTRVCKILALATMQIGVLETMTPLDFLDFRDLLRPASGFQGIQFKIIEATLGLRFEQRYGKEYYISHLKPDDVERVKKAEQEESLLVLVNRWLERMPFVNHKEYWEADFNFWNRYRKAYAASLSKEEKRNLTEFDSIFIHEADYPKNRAFSISASRSALFILLYSDYPLLQLPYELLNILVDIDERLADWRHRHIHLVQHTIGRRIGTGGSSGIGYLKGAAKTNVIFKELAELTSFLLPRHLIPPLPKQLIKELSFHP